MTLKVRSNSDSIQGKVRPFMPSGEYYGPLFAAQACAVGIPESDILHRLPRRIFQVYAEKKNKIEIREYPRLLLYGQDYSQLLDVDVLVMCLPK